MSKLNSVFTCFSTAMLLTCVTLAAVGTEVSAAAHGFVPAYATSFVPATANVLASSSTFSAASSTISQLEFEIAKSTSLADSSQIIAARSDDSEFELGKIDVSPSTGPLSNEQLDKLLAKRLPAMMGASFSQFANMILVPGQEKSGCAISLETRSDRIGKTLLRSPFPAFYRPTLRQFLDEIAWQTKANWKYDADEKTMKKKASDLGTDKQIALFEFNDADRAKLYDLKPTNGWTTQDNGNWTMYSPPASTGSMDVYEMGTYSAQDKSVEPEMLSKVCSDLAIGWARRVQAKAKLSDLTKTKVGPFDAFFFEANVKSQNKHDVHWRQWVFMDGEQCYFIVSTIYPEDEDKLFPDVKAMLNSFRAKH